MPVLSDEDQLTDTKSIYNVSKWEIFWRNFIAGMGRALGAIILQAIFLLVIVNLFMNQVWPVIQPILQMMETTTQSLEQLNQQTQQDFDIFKFGQ
jgi:hypothetical protein